MRIMGQIALLLVLPFSVLAGSAASETLSSVIEGVFSVTPVGTRACIAGEFGVPAGRELLGIRWYNNDAGTTFQDIVLVDDLAAFITGSGYHFGAVVAGVTEGWVELGLPSPIRSVDGTMFVVFVLPAEVEYEHAGEGGGPAIGFTSEAGQYLVQISPDGESWIGVERQVALEGLVSAGASVTSAKSVAATSATVDVLVTGLQRMYPNPGNPSIGLDYSLERDADVVIDVFSLKGQSVCRLVDAHQSRGAYSVAWGGQDSRGSKVGSGLYLLRFQAGSYCETSKIVISR